MRQYYIPGELFSCQLPSEFELAFSIAMKEPHIGLKALKAQASDLLGPRIHTTPVRLVMLGGTGVVRGLYK